MNAENSTIPNNTTLFDQGFNFLHANNIFAVYFAGLVILAYALSIVISILHLRKESVVHILTRPEPDAYFSEYVILIRTSHMIGSSFDYRGRISIQLNGLFSDSVKLHLKEGKGIEYFLERGTTNIFVYHSPTVLGDIFEVEISMVNDAPNEIPHVDWIPAYISIFHPITKMQWGGEIERKLRCFDTLTEIIECKPNTIDNYSILEAFCSFHVGLSLFNSPLRFGMYNNLVNVIVIFFTVSGLMFATVLDEIAVMNSESKNDVSLYRKKSLIDFLRPIFVIWLLEICFEAIFRNTVPRVSTSAYSMFQGLTKPAISSKYRIQDFVVDYNWQKVSLLVPQRKVITPYGSRHHSSQNIFPVEPVFSYFNMWGQLNLEVERCGNWYFRSMSICALSLPQSMRWLAREVKSQKEDMLVQQYISNFTAPMCYFCCWLKDWPLHYIEEPNQVGLIISHIICADILSLSRLKNKEYCARLAQICAHQWHGMIAYILLHIVRQSLEYRGQSLLGVRSFINRTLTSFRKRNAREIQAGWRKRQIRLKELTFKNTQEIPFVAVEEDENESATLEHSKTCNVERTLWNIICQNYREEEEWSDTHNFRQNFSVMDFNDFTQDFLVFDRKDSDAQTLEDVCTGFYSKSVLNMEGKHPKVMPKFSIVKEIKIRYRSRRKSMKKLRTNRRRPLVNLISQDGTEDNGISLANAGGDTNASIDGPLNVIEICCTAAEKYSFPGASNYNSDMNMNAVINHDEQDSDENEQLVADSYVPKSVEKHIQQTSLVQKIVERKRLQKLGTIKERVSLPVATYEEVTLGPPFDVFYAKENDPNDPFCYLRHADEMLAYACDNDQCKANADIHRMVGVSSLEILKKFIRELLYFALDSDHIGDNKKLWKRKKIVSDLFQWMNEKAEEYDSGRFKASKDSIYNGTFCNQTFTALLTSLEILVDLTVNIKQTADFKSSEEREELYDVFDHPQVRCVYCAKFFNFAVESNNKGCYSMERLVRFFSKTTIAVAEKEINIEFAYKHSVQRFCAMIMNNAMKEVALELEDPPLVMACKVTRAMICKLIDKLLPKAINFKGMTVDELRRVGTRRDRIRARKDPTLGAGKRKTEAEKRMKQMLINLQEQLKSKWRIGVKENDLEYCARLLAQILVHEEFMGFSVYTGFLLKEHEEILNGSLNRLIEIETKAHTAVLKIARFMMRPILKSALETSHNADVLFRNAEIETMYILEAVCVAQMFSEPTFLRTCCYYIEDIIHQKVEEFKSFFLYMKNFHSSDELKAKLKPKLFKCKFKANESIKLHVAKYHSLVASPVHRWGLSSFKGIALPNELRSRIVTEIEFKDLLPSIIEACTTEKKQEIVLKLLETRLNVITYLDLQKSKRNKELRVHLAQVQANLTEQIALLSQSITNTFSVDIDFQREFSNDDLFNVEFYATGNMNLPFPTNMGLLLLILLIVATLGMILIATVKAGAMTVEEVQTWFLRFVYSFLTYSLLLEPLKCVGYFILQLYAR